MWWLAFVYFCLSSAVLTPIYPVPSFIRTFYDNDPFAGSYCLNTASYGAEQACDLGQITTGSDPSKFSFGEIGGVGRSFTRLGTLSEIHDQYKISFNWGNLRWVPSEDRLVFENVDNRTMTIPLKESAVADLLNVTTRAAVERQGNAGVYFLVRLTESPGITKTLSEGTTVFAVVLVLDDAVVRWGILASIEPEAAIVAYQKEFLGPVASRTALDVVAIIISISAVIIASVISCVTWRQRGYKVVN